ncbi:MAG: bifunctional DNA-formamidopyrimidine glycosylase/DNA-(apurinic or apyrimidinic site) lyase [Nitrospirales bacterium]|nr:bifunctional DNA-formamidopyrimidine glycosylase/DNA-(apurinic or apyrimidinic site) lyase [Nitrospirales bacterium]
MPELPEVESVLRQLRRHVLGTTIRSIWVGRQDIIREGIDQLPWYEGACIQDIQRYGKTLLFTCEKGQGSQFLLAELGMTGRFLFHGVPQKFAVHTHMVVYLATSHTPELRYWNARRFGRIYLLNAHDWQELRGRRFGLDPLSVEPMAFIALIQQSRGRLKAFLMNQQKIAGIGNIYANEILHRAGIHPHASGNRLKKKTLHRLFATMQAVLQEAIVCGGSTIRDFCTPDGSPGCFQERHQVYQKTGTFCLRGCGTRIRRLSQERSAFFCPTCQKRR